MLFFSCATNDVQHGWITAIVIYEKEKVGTDQETAQSERNSYSITRDGEKINRHSGTYTKKTYHKPSEQLFPPFDHSVTRTLLKYENVHMVQTTQKSTPKQKKTNVDEGGYEWMKELGLIVELVFTWPNQECVVFVGRIKV